MVRRLGVALAVCVLLPAPEAAAVSFSLRAGSPSVPGVSSADVLTAGPVGGPPVVAFSASALGLLPNDELDALSFGLFQGQEPYFSVDAASSGAAGTAVAAESAAGQAAGDVFKDPFPVDIPTSGNVIVANQDALGLAPAVGPGVPNLLPLDDIDALDMDAPSLADPTADGIPDIPVYFSLGPNSPTLGIIGAGPADILVTQPFGLPQIALSAMTLGFVPGDDIDALLYDPGVGGTLLVSLASGSPTLALLGGTGADVFAPLIFPPGFLGPSLINQTISTLGLVTTDELDAFSDAPIPEPGSAGLLLLGLCALLAHRVRRTAPG